jgi:hypothetical protein
MTETVGVKVLTIVLDKDGTMTLAGNLSADEGLQFLTTFIQGRDRKIIELNAVEAYKRELEAKKNETPTE